MKILSFDYSNTCLIDRHILEKIHQKLAPEVQTLLQAHTTHYETAYASINLPFDNALRTFIKNIVKEKKQLNPALLIIIGIGGSNLGTLAILQALRGKLYNNHLPIPVYFVDTVDVDYVNCIIKLAEKELIKGNTLILNIISKSGTTLETITNFSLFLQLLKNYRPHDYHRFIVITTNKNSPLWNTAQQDHYTSLEIPYNIGGRYSVFSAVGLFPLCFLGINIDNLCAGAQNGFLLSTNKKISHNFAALSASIIATHYQKGKIIHDTFLFSIDLESFGAWYRQLSAESIGKKYDINNNLVNIGLLPTISIGSTDLHSVAQLYLAGPQNRFTTFINIEQHHEQLLSTTMNALLEGIKKSYHTIQHPFISVTLPQKSAYYIGQYMQIKMIEIMYLAFLLKVNPFDQPDIERSKKDVNDTLSITTLMAS